MGAPALFITENCPNLVEQLRFAPVDPVEGEIVDPFWETRHGHGLAAARYLLTARIFPGDVADVKESGMMGRTLGSWKEGTQWRAL